jgi:hypothetical protein
MKIRVQGNTIDTEDIRSITDIKTDFEGTVDFRFRIKIADRDELLVKHCIPSENLHVYYAHEPRVRLDDEGYTGAKTFKSMSEAIKYIEELPLFSIEYNKIKTLYDSVIAYWSNNQSKIPNLEII